MDQALNKAKIWDMAWVYTPSVSTDIQRTWIANGFVPPSATFMARDKWHLMKHRLYINEERFR